jgi:predicted anti-sigma-YlaC factor YlaD
MMGADQFEEKMLNTKRAKNLFLRGADYVLAGLGKEYRAFSEYASSPDYPALLPAVKKKDAAFLYWLAAGWMGAVSVDPFDMKLSPLKDRAKAAMDAAYRLDSNFNNGAIDEFYMAWYAAMPDFMGGSDALAKEHFNRAVEKTGGQLASVYVSYAEAVSVKNQNRAEFEQLLIQALKADSSLYPDFTLANELFKRKAAWLLKHGEDFFISEDF